MSGSGVAITPRGTYTSQNAAKKCQKPHGRERHPQIGPRVRHAAYRDEEKHTARNNQNER